MFQSRRHFMKIGASAAVSSALMFGSTPYALADAIDYDVSGDFPIIQQIGNTCWATTGTMMYNWKHASAKSVDEVMKMAGDPYALLYSQKVALTMSDLPNFISFLGLKSEPPASYPPGTIKNLLKNNGLLWITTLSSVSSCSFSLHARIVRGIHGDSSASDHTTLAIVDPAAGTASDISLSQFYKAFEGYAQAENACDPNEPLQPQILHF